MQSNNGEMKLDYDKIDLASIDMHINTSDYPDFADSYICAADYDGRSMTDAELDVLNSDSDFVYEQILKRLH